MSPQLAQQIRAWAKTEDYTLGLRLFRERYGENIRYRALTLGQSLHNRQKLRELLLADLPEESATAPAPQQKDDPEAVARWREETQSLQAERIQMKQRLRDLDDSQTAERKKVAFRILGITERLDSLFGKIRYYEQYGRVPEEEKPEEEPVRRHLPREVLNLRTYISRETKKLHSNCNCDACTRRKKRIEEWFLRMKELEIETA